MKLGKIGMKLGISELKNDMIELKGILTGQINELRKDANLLKEKIK